jgi:hypothetical protein
MADHWVITALSSMQPVRGRTAGDNSYPIAGEGYELGGQPQPGLGIDIRRGSPVSVSLLFKNDDNRPAWMCALLLNLGSSVEWEDASREG